MTKHFRVREEDDFFWVYRRTVFGLWAPVSCHFQEAEAVARAKALYELRNRPKVRRVVFSTKSRYDNWFGPRY